MRKPLLLTTILLFSLAAGAQNRAKTFSLQQAIAFALDNNNAVKNAKLDVEEARYRGWEIKTTGLPKIDANFDYNYYFKTPQAPAFTKIFSDTSSASTKNDLHVAQYFADSLHDPTLFQNLAAAAKNAKPFSFVLPHQATAGITLSQLIFDARYAIGVSAVKDLTYSQIILKERTDIEVAYNVRKAYIQATAGQESEASLRTVKEIVDKIVNDARATFKEGLIEELDVNRLELIQSNLESQILLQDQLAELALVNLKFQMGLPISEEIILTDKLTSLKDRMPAAGDSKFDPTKRVEYRLLETAVRLKTYDVKQRRAGYYPSLVGFVNFGYNAQLSDPKYFFKNEQFQGQTLKSWNPQGLVGLKLAIPIFDSGQKWASIRQAKMELEKSKNDVENFKQAAELQVRLAQTNFNSAVQDENATSRSVALSQKIFDKTNIKYKEGVGSSFELSQAQQDLVTNRLKYVQSVMNLLINRSELDKAMGIQ
ncbi:MAG: TolC family protein [Chitinophagales bacterium]